jgi:hypothetical protein
MTDQADADPDPDQADADPDADPDRDTDDPPEIDADERATPPDDLLDDVDPDEIEPSSIDDTDEQDDDGADGGDDGADEQDDDGVSNIKAGKLYVDVVQSTTNQIIRSKGGPDAEEVDRGHFEALGLDQHFDRTMQKALGGDDVPPEKALIITTLLAIGGPIASETDVLADAFGGGQA